jgi:hypothetical protein
MAGALVKVPGGKAKVLKGKLRPRLSRVARWEDSWFPAAWKYSRCEELSSVPLARSPAALNGDPTPSAFA